MLSQNARNTKFGVEILIIMQYIKNDRSIVTNSFRVLNGRKHGIRKWWKVGVSSVAIYEEYYVQLVHAPLYLLIAE